LSKNVFLSCMWTREPGAGAVDSLTTVRSVLGTGFQFRTHIN
jgi:hypothetical protein